MGLFDGKTPAERNKTIAAIALGVLSLIALYMAFGGGLFGSRAPATTASAKPTPTPAKTTAAPQKGDQNFAIPSQQDQALQNEVTPVVYNPNSAYAPDPGRNIFEFYEPPPPCKINCPSPTPTPIPQKPTPTPTPAPTPPIMLANVAPNFVYAGSAAFKIDINGAQIPSDAKVYFANAELQTTITTNHLTAEVPANLIANEGPKQIIVRTADGRLYSNPLMITAQAPPKPSTQFIGAMLRSRGNNNTAIMQAPGQQTPFSARLNDLIEGRFRIVDISPTEVVVVDKDLGFKHRIPVQKDPGGANRGGAPNGFSPYGTTPGFPQQMQLPRGDKKEDVDDNIPPRQ